jgi:YidC/Oxa1 family membrane protein insertase
MEIYRTEKINPFSGLFLAIVQIPILIALYQVFWHGLKPGALESLYGFVSNPGHINAMFIGLIDLAKPNIPLAFIAGILQFFQTKMLLPAQDKTKPKEKNMASMMQTQMVYIFPFVTIIILWKLPSALGLYWIISGIFSIVQQYFILKKAPK